MKAIDSPSSVVCTGSPFEHVPVRRLQRGTTVHPPGEARHRTMLMPEPSARRRAEISAGSGPYIRPTVAKSQQHRATA